MLFNDDDLVICAARRTPLGAFLGQLAPLSATDMGSATVTACLEQVGLTATALPHGPYHSELSQPVIDSLYMGCVLTAGLGQAPARQVALNSGLPDSTCCTTLNKVCGSGMKSVMLGCDQLRLGQAHAVIAGGMESMSRAPFLLPNVRSGKRFGHGEMLDHLYLDGLEDAYSGQLMGSFADAAAVKFGISRTDMDSFALRSLQRAKNAIAEGLFITEIAPLSINHRGEKQLLTVDEAPLRADPQRIPQIPPAFADNGLITAANASSMADGAAALLLTTGANAKRWGWPPLARILGYTCHSQQPAEFTQAPVGAICKLLRQLKWQVQTPDLYEINEAFAMVTLLAINQLGIDGEKVNVNGGACALGHPLGATGARILVTLLYALQQRGGGRGIASLCIGGGEATAMAIETLC